MWRGRELVRVGLSHRFPAPVKWVFGRFKVSNRHTNRHTALAESSQVIGMPRSVIGNTLGSGPRDSWFEPRRGNLGGREASRAGFGFGARLPSAQLLWTGGRAVEGARLESVWASQAPRGFESHPVRGYRIERRMNVELRTSNFERRSNLFRHSMFDVRCS